MQFLCGLTSLTRFRSLRLELLFDWLAKKFIDWFKSLKE